MIKFTVEIKVIAELPEDKEMQNIYMQNAEDVIQRGLNAMTVPDWEANVIKIEEDSSL